MINKDIKIIAALGSFLTLLSAAICLFIYPICALVCLSLGLVLTCIFLFVTKKRYEKLSELNNYLSLVCSGQYALDISDNAEGELSILKNNLYLSVGQSAIPFEINIPLYIGVILVVYAIIGATMLYAVSKLKDDSIVETLKEEIN